MPNDYSLAHKMRVASGEAKKPSQPAPEEKGHPLTEDPDITVGPGQGVGGVGTTRPRYALPMDLPLSQRKPESLA